MKKIKLKQFIRKLLKTITTRYVKFARYRNLYTIDVKQSFIVYEVTYPVPVPLTKTQYNVLSVTISKVFKVACNRKLLFTMKIIKDNVEEFIYGEEYTFYKQLEGFIDQGYEILKFKVEFTESVTKQLKLIYRDLLGNGDLLNYEYTYDGIIKLLERTQFVNKVMKLILHTHYSTGVYDISVILHKDVNSISKKGGEDVLVSIFPNLKTKVPYAYIDFNDLLDNTSKSIREEFELGLDSLKQVLSADMFPELMAVYRAKNINKMIVGDAYSVIGPLKYPISVNVSDDVLIIFLADYAIIRNETIIGMDYVLAQTLRHYRDTLLLKNHIKSFMRYPEFVNNKIINSFNKHLKTGDFLKVFRRKSHTKVLEYALMLCCNLDYCRGDIILSDYLCDLADMYIPQNISINLHDYKYNVVNVNGNLYKDDSYNSHKFIYWHDYVYNKTKVISSIKALTDRIKNSCHVDFSVSLTDIKVQFKPDEYYKIRFDLAGVVIMLLYAQNAPFSGILMDILAYVIKRDLIMLKEMVLNEYFTFTTEDWMFTSVFVKPALQKMEKRMTQITNRFNDIKSLKPSQDDLKKSFHQMKIAQTILERTKKQLLNKFGSFDIELTRKDNFMEFSKFEEAFFDLDDILISLNEVFHKIKTTRRKK